MPDPSEETITEKRVTFCRICEAMCGLVAEVQDGKIARILPDRDNPHSQGFICVKGPAMKEVVYDQDRILTPLRRAGGPGMFEPVSWDEALDDIACRMVEILTRDGPSAIAAYIGNPVFWNVFSWFPMRAFFSRYEITKLFSPGTQDLSSRLLTNYLLYRDVTRFPIPDLLNCDFLMVFGSNMLVSHGSMVTIPRLREALDDIAQRGRVIFVDPRATETAQRYEHVSIVPDMDVWLLAAMLREIFVGGRADIAFFEGACNGWADLRDAVMWITPELAEARCGVPAEAFIETKRAAIFARAGICRGRHSTIANMLVDAINMAGGKFGQPGGQVFGHDLNDHVMVTGAYAANRSRIGDMPDLAGFLPCVIMPDEILEPGPGQVKAMVTISGNPVLSAPGGAKLEGALEQLDLHVSLDLFVTETNRFADYILPTTTFLERDDMPLLCFSRMIRPYMQYARAVVPPLGSVREEEDIFRDLSVRIDQVQGSDRGAPIGSGKTVVEALLRSGPLGDVQGEAGLTLDKLRALPHGVMIAEKPVEQRWRHNIFHSDGRIVLWNSLIADEFKRLAEAPPASGLRLFGRRDLKSINSWMHNVDRMVDGQRPALLMHPQDAASRGLATGALVTVSNRFGAVEVPVEVTGEVRVGSVCYPHGWGHQGGWRRANAAGGANINVLSPTDPAEIDWVSGSSLMDGIEVEVRAAGTAKGST
jgi:formate dehydrogenase